MWGVAKSTGRPLHPDFSDVWDWPHTLSYVVSLRQRYDSYLELIEPLPEEHWDYPHLVRQHIERIYPNSKNKRSGGDEVVEIEMADIEE